MESSKALFHDVMSRIEANDDLDEIKTIALMLLESVFGLRRSDIMAGRMVEVTPVRQRLLDDYIGRLNRHEPVQYVLGKAFFYGRVFKVNPSVLIPRPETEELVRAVLEWRKVRAHLRANEGPRILDIGTGSGCIPVTLSLEWPGSEVFALDVSPDAIAVAKENAYSHETKINFIEQDILKEDIPLANLDIIVSNPPYIAMSEKESLLPNVLEFEPHLALFAPDDDPLIFYKTIAVKAKAAMNAGGLLAFEINEKYGMEVLQLLMDNGWNGVELLHDLSGKPRVVKATS